MWIGSQSGNGNWPGRGKGSLRIPVERAEMYIPEWVGCGNPSDHVLHSERPVLLEVVGGLAGVHTRLLQLNHNTARLRVVDPLLLLPRVAIEVHFRWAGANCVLAGQTDAAAEDGAAILRLDEASRRWLEQQYKVLLAEGLMDAEPEQDWTTMLWKGMERAEPTGDGNRREAPVRMIPRSQLTRVEHKDPPMDQERRDHPRREVRLEAELSFVNTKVVMVCLLLEISQSGCRVYTEEKMAFGEGAAVEVRFNYDGQPYRLPAHIQVKAHDQLAGLEFDALSERIEQRLQALLADQEP